MLTELIAAIKEQYIKLIAEPTLKLQERSAMITHLKHRISQFERQKTESEGIITTPNLIQAAIPTSPNSENILQAYIDRYHRRMLDIALKQSRGKAEVALSISA